MLAKYLAAIEPTIGPRHVSTWRTKYDDALIDALIAEGILYDAGLADWYPCGAYCGERRPVLRQLSRPQQPYYAPCKIGDGCEGQRLQESDLPLFGHSFSRVVEVLRKQLGIAPSPSPEVAIARGIHRLGTVVRSGVAADVFLAIVPEEKQFPLFLATRAPLPRRTWLLATTLRWVPDVLVAAHAPGAHVELSALSDLLEVRDRRIVRVGATEPSGVDPTPERPRAIATLLTGDGVHALGPAEYADVVANASDRFDLFVDVSREHRSGKRTYCVAGHRDERSRYHEVKLRPVQARGIADFIELARDRFVLPEDLPSLGGHDAAGTFRKAWPEIDPERRAIHRQKLTFRFAPAADLRWALLRAIDANGASKHGV